MTVTIPEPQLLTLRNMWRDTREMNISDSDVWRSTESYVSARQPSELKPGFYRVELTNAGLDNPKYVFQNAALEVGERYTLSFVCDQRGLDGTVSVIPCRDSAVVVQPLLNLAVYFDGIRQQTTANHQYFIPAGKQTRVEIRFDAEISDVNTFFRALTGSAGTLRLEQFQLEKGDAATEWTPHPDDPPGTTGYSETFNRPSVSIRTTFDIDRDKPAGITMQVENAAGDVADEIAVPVEFRPGAKYAIYAVNRRGGITHLVCDGTPHESHTRSAWDIDSPYDPLLPLGRGVRRMSTTTVRKWRLNTGYLSEADAAEMDDIVNSPRIVLHDLETDRLFAVNSDNGTVDTKTRRSNSHKLIEYALDFSEARKEIRR